MSEQLKYRSNSIYYTAHTDGYNPEGGNDFPLDMCAGWWYGMGGTKMPSWQTGTDGEHFATIEDAQKFIKGLSLGGYGWRIQPDTPVTFMKHRVVTEHYVEEMV